MARGLLQFFQGNLKTTHHIFPVHKGLIVNPFKPKILDTRAGDIKTPDMIILSPDEMNFSKKPCIAMKKIYPEGAQGNVGLTMMDGHQVILAEFQSIPGGQFLAIVKTGVSFQLVQLVIHR